MKKLFLLISLATIAFNSFAQTNTFPSTGSAGIGTTAPSAFLHVIGATEQLRIGYDASNYAKFTTSSAGGLTITPTGTTPLTTITGQTTITGSLVAGTSGSNIFIATTGGTTSTAVAGYQFAGSTNTYFRAGIGGTSSTSLATARNYSGLNVASSPFTLATSINIPFAASAVINAVGAITIGTGSSVTNTATLYVDGANTQGTNNYAIYSSGGLNYFAGNVAINTATMPAGYQFAVNGSMIATAVTVKLYSNWPDYVFKKNYHLLPLADVKNYIEKNHHLPDMPSEQQVADNGLNLGEMNKLLVKKVEELTIYLIDQQKVLEQQQKALEIQSAKTRQLEEKIDKLTTQKKK